MSVELLTILFFGALLLFVMLGTPLAFALGGISVIFLYAEMGELGFYLLASKMWETDAIADADGDPLVRFHGDPAGKIGGRE